MPYTIIPFQNNNYNIMNNNINYNKSIGAYKNPKRNNIKNDNYNDIVIENMNTIRSNNIYDNPNEENYIDGNIYEEEEYEENDYINYGINNENNEIEDSSSYRKNNPKNKEVIIDHVKEIYQTPEYEEYYSNIKLMNESENTSNIPHKNEKNKRKDDLFKKRLKKIEKQNSSKSN